MIVIDEATSSALLSMGEVIAAVEQAFLGLHRGEAETFPVARGAGPQPGSTFGVKSGIIRSMGAVGLKVGSYWPTNVAKGIPSHGSTVILLDPDTGFPTALVSTSHLNALRTAAADALAVRHLARADARTLGVIGAGHQAWYEIEAIREVRPVEQVLVWARDPAKAEAFAAKVAAGQGIAARAATAEEAAGCDLVTSATASREPLIDPAWLRPGTHVSAMGADGVGKRELGRPYPAGARLFADMATQSRTIGEFQGLEDPIIEIGAVIAGDADGRRADDEITIFDSSGIALQDLSLAKAVLAKHEG